jgi:alpha/beta hydrolase fold
MARDALVFVDALGLKRIDLLGFSLGGYVAQEIALLRPRLVRRIILAGTAPQGGPGLHRWTDDVYELATQDETSAERFLRLFFSGSEDSQAKGREYLGRAYARKNDRDAPTDLACRDAQLAAITAWGIPAPSQLDRLAGITQPTFVAVGDNDTMMHTKNSASSPTGCRTRTCGSTPTRTTASSTSTQSSSPTTSTPSSTSDRDPGWGRQGPLCRLVRVGHLRNRRFADPSGNRGHVQTADGGCSRIGGLLANLGGRL